MLLSGYKKQTILSLSYDFEILRKKKKPEYYMRYM